MTASARWAKRPSVRSDCVERCGEAAAESSSLPDQITIEIRDWAHDKPAKPAQAANK